MAQHIESLTDWSEGKSRRLRRAVIMHGTSTYREIVARLMVQLIHDMGAHGIAFGWTDTLNPDTLAPVHLVAATEVHRWALAEPGTVVEAVTDLSPLRWWLVIRGVSGRRVDLHRARVGYLAAFLRGAAHRDVPPVDHQAHAFIELLGGYRMCGFHLEERHRRWVREEFIRQIEGLPSSTHCSARRVVRALRDRGSLQGSLLDFGHSLDRAGAFQLAAGVHLVGYELALHRGSGTAGVDAARSAGRAFRRAGQLDASLEWYDLARDGLGNTHRYQGSFPRAPKAKARPRQSSSTSAIRRASYAKAWEFAKLSGDALAIGNVATSMAVVERWAGDLVSASRFAWAAIENAQDADARAGALISLGTILREGCAALRGDADGHDGWRRTARGSRPREPFIRAQIGYFRARSLMALGRAADARRMLDAVERYARRWGVTQWEVKAGELGPLPSRPAMDTPPEVREGLRALQLASI